MGSGLIQTRFPANRPGPENPMRGAEPRVSRQHTGLRAFRMCGSRRPLSPLAPRAQRKTPVDGPRRGFGSRPASIRRSGQEVALDAEHDAVTFSPFGPQGHVRAFVRRVKLGPQHVDADVESRMRIPLGPRAELPPVSPESTRCGADAERRGDAHALCRVADTSEEIT